EFIPIVDQDWKKEIAGCQMYKLVKKLKMLKPKLNALNWKNGNLFNKVVKPRDMVKDKHRILDKDPHNGILKNDMVKTLNDYQDAILDEENMIYQKAKIKWLKKGEDVAEEFVKHFNDFLGNNHTIFSIEDSADLFSKQLTEEEAN
ncbi:hypothetical protein Tco_1454004, partial [Tanacetum coccineum]